MSAIKIGGLVLGGVIAVPLALVTIIASLLGGGGLHLGPPVNLGAVSPPAAIVSLDDTVSAGSTCHVPAAILLAQQWVESAYSPTARSGAGAIGLAQFEPATFASYAHPVPPGGANPPTPLDPVDSAWAEARMLCSGGITVHPTSALVAYNCGNPGPACRSIAAGYASEILHLAVTISTPPQPAAAVKP